MLEDQLDDSREAEIDSAMSADAGTDSSGFYEDLGSSDTPTSDEAQATDSADFEQRRDDLADI